MKPDDIEAAKHLRGFCETCNDWHDFEAIDRNKGCPVHGTKFSSRIGFQITTQRTPVMKLKKLTKKDSAA
jgi:hypothetical protein